MNNEEVKLGIGLKTLHSPLKITKAKTKSNLQLVHISYMEISCREFCLEINYRVLKLSRQPDMARSFAKDVQEL